MAVGRTQAQYAAAFSYATQLRSFMAGFKPMLCLAHREIGGEDVSTNTETAGLMVARSLARACPALQLISFCDDGHVCAQGVPLYGCLEQLYCVGPFLETVNGEPLQFWLPSVDMMAAAAGWHTLRTFGSCLASLK